METKQLVIPKRTLVVIAKIISEIPEKHRLSIAKHFAKKLEDYNPQFNKLRFLMECEVFKEL